MVPAGRHHHFPAGHCEREGAVAGAVREAGEEAGLTASPHAVELVRTVHMVDEVHEGDDQPRIGLVFRARTWVGGPEVREPDKCVERVWADPARLPGPIVGYARTAIGAIGRGAPYSELGRTA
ncbi:NUDIX domain-containing protein [Streptomyces sp. NPDC056773]|uniref:NUDIX domain-containing protein n=1 Tax=unclassified Streptomyces TaxID=2593676 RepID=UPI0036C781D9